MGLLLLAWEEMRGREGREGRGGVDKVIIVVIVVNTLTDKLKSHEQIFTEIKYN